MSFFDDAKKEFIEVLYDKDWICPIVKDQHNSKEDVIAKMNNPQYPDNFLLVCEIGTYGVNIPSLSLLFHSRDTLRHDGKVYTVEQLLGRLTRNRFIDNYYLCDFIVSLNPDIKHLELLKKSLMNLTKKSVVLFVTHDFKQDEKDIPLNECKVELCFYKNKWIKVNKTDLKIVLNKLGNNWNINKLKL